MGQCFSSIPTKVAHGKCPMLGIEPVERWNSVINQSEGVLPDVGRKRLGQKTIIIVNVGGGKFGVLNT